MNIAIFAYSRQGCETADQVRAVLAGPGDECRACTMEKYRREGFEAITPPSSQFIRHMFQWADAMVFVGACGIAVRSIAPCVKDKRTDPAVLVVDERGRFVISLLSGHIGGANTLTVRLAEALGAVPVVTTATDVNGRFSVDTWAAENGLYIDSMWVAKAVSAAILDGPVPLTSDFPVRGKLPPGVVRGEGGPVGVCVSWRKRKPFAQTLLLVPPILRLGIGCRKGTGAKTIAALVDEVLEENHVHPMAVKTVASIDLKKEEPGLLAFCKERGWPAEFYSAEELSEVEGDFTSSAFVHSVAGVDNVCERAAMNGAERLLIRKTARNGVTVALAVEHWEVCFG